MRQLAQYHGEYGAVFLLSASRNSFAPPDQGTNADRRETMPSARLAPALALDSLAPEASSSEHGTPGVVASNGLRVVDISIDDAEIEPTRRAMSGDGDAGEC